MASFTYCKCDGSCHNFKNHAKENGSNLCHFGLGGPVCFTSYDRHLAIVAGSYYFFCIKYDDTKIIKPKTKLKKKKFICIFFEVVLCSLGIPGRNFGHGDSAKNADAHACKSTGMRGVLCAFSNTPTKQPTPAPTKHCPIKVHCIFVLGSTGKNDLGACPV
ncbi:unnamed protein product [Ixodes pacificus]